MRQYARLQGFQNIAVVEDSDVAIQALCKLIWSAFLRRKQSVDYTQSNGCALRAQPASKKLAAPMARVSE
jgi:hypothetical protein